MDWLKDRIKKLGKTGAGLAAALEIPKTRVYEMYRGDRRIQATEVAKAARFLEMSEAELLALIGDEPVAATHKSHVKKSRARMQPDDENLAPLISYKTARSSGGEFGGFVITREKDADVKRPSFLAYNQKAFALKVLDDANAPVYRVRDQILINPEDQGLRDEDCLFAQSNDPLNDGECLVGNLVEVKTSHWVVRQYARKDTIELPRSRFPCAFPIVGRYVRR